ncbi:class F sortase [Candidatus Saccharibacteria bacterium]|nr:class F sortase [Candidatus Saccharibacteria bacterium]
MAKPNDQKRPAKLVLRITLLVIVLMLAVLGLIATRNGRRLAEAHPTTGSAVTLTTGEILEVDPHLPVEQDPCVNEAVAADLPRFISIPSANVDRACVRHVGYSNIDNPDGSTSRQILTASNARHVGWYRYSARPDDTGAVFVSGHSSNDFPAVFNDLRHLKVGETITIETGDGRRFHYRVFETLTMSIAEANLHMPTMLSSLGSSSLSIVTCTGRWLHNQRTMENRVMVRAHLERVE